MVRLTRGRQWRRGVSCDGEQTEDQALGIRQWSTVGLTEGSVACQMLIQEYTSLFVFTVHVMCTHLWHSSNLASLFGNSPRNNINCPKMNQNYPRDILSWERTSVPSCSC